MTSKGKRMRIFAGPNGSGKTTVKNSLSKSEAWFGVYINPDIIESNILNQGYFDPTALGIDFDTEELIRFFRQSVLLTSKSVSGEQIVLSGTAERIHFSGCRFNSYHSAVLCDFLRRQALKQGISFTFETVMSSSDKVDLMHEAKRVGYRTYLYFVSTDDPAINIQRVKIRVDQGGHDVPEKKIISRYTRSIGLLLSAIQASDRAFIFDTSDEKATFIAEIENGTTLSIMVDEIPSWFAYVNDYFHVAE
jgi:predicted ABC-type ATPase